MSDDPKTHEGWFRIYEEDLRTIERTFDREGARRKAIAALLTVTRIANLEGAATFTRPISSIARDMAYSYPHAHEALHHLKAAGILKITEQNIAGSKEKAPSRYTLTRLEQNVTRLLPTKKSGEGQRVSNNLQELLPRTTKDTADADLPAKMEEVVEAWRATSLTGIRAITADRKKALKARLADSFFRDNFREGIAKAAQTPLCTGSNDRGWSATFDWFLKPGSLVQILEGKYEGKPKVITPPKRDTCL